MEREEIELKIRINKARRAAQRQGLILKKSRARYIYPKNINDYGGFMLIDASTNIIKDGEKYKLSLEDIEKILFE